MNGNEKIIVKQIHGKNVKNVYTELYNSNNTNHSFQRIEIIKACNSIYYKLRRQSVISFFVVYKNDNLVLIAPLRIKKQIAYIAGYYAMMDYNDFIYNEKMELSSQKEAIEGLMNFLRKKKIKEIRFNFVDINSNTYKILNELDLLHNISEVTNVCITIPEKYDTYFNTLSKQTKQNIRTARNRLKKDDFKIQFDWYAESTTNKKMKKINKKDTLLYLLRQKNKYRRNYIHNFYIKYFHYATVVSNNDFCIIAELKINNELAGFYKGYLNGNKDSIEIPRLAINEKYSHYSPGILLIDESIKYISSKTKIKRFDLCRGSEIYKIRMGGNENITCNFSVLL